MVILCGVVLFVVGILFLGAISKSCWFKSGDRSKWTLLDLFMEGLFLLVIFLLLCAFFYGMYLVFSSIWSML